MLCYKNKINIQKVKLISQTYLNVQFLVIRIADKVQFLVIRIADKVECPVYGHLYHRQT